MKTGWLRLTINDLAEMKPAEINMLIIELREKKIEKQDEDKSLPSKEEFEKTVEELIKQGKLDKKFLGEQWQKKLG